MYITSTFLASALAFSACITATPVPNADSNSATSTVAAAASSPSVVIGSDSGTQLSLTDRLILAPTAADRLGLLTDADFIYDFNSTTPVTGATTTGKGGHTVKADRKTFPALIGTGGSMTLGFLGPCGLNTPHVHPRAAELNIVVEGRLMASVTAENGVRHMNHTLEQFQMTVFPAGAVHTEFNPDCVPATFVAAFPSEDPGVQQSAQTFFGLEDDIIEAVLGAQSSGVTIDGADLDKFRSLIPANVALGVESCLKKCNIPMRKV